MTRKYFNEKAAIWDEGIAEKNTTKLERMVSRLNIKPGSVVLDIGTGTGVFLPFILRVTGTRGRIIALDFAEKMLKLARVKDFGANIDYLQADVTYIPLHDETFDTVVCYSSFPHFKDKTSVLIEINRVIKGGGRLLICHTSSRAQINEIHRQIPVVKNDILPDATEMQSLLTEAGFSEIIVEDGTDSYLASAMKPYL